MIIPPGVVHAGERAESGGGWEYSALYPGAGDLNAISAELVESKRTVDFGSRMLVRDIGLSRLLLNAIRVAVISPDPLERQGRIYGALECLIRCYGGHSRGDGRFAPLDVNIGRARDFINTHFADSLTANDIARTVGLSEFHFMRTFRAQTGLSVHAYLTQTRLDRAKTLLASGTEAALAAVAVGFFDQSHFSNAFRAHFGLTPMQFARACR